MLISITDVFLARAYAMESLARQLGGSAPARHHALRHRLRQAMRRCRGALMQMR